MSRAVTSDAPPPPLLTVPVLLPAAAPALSAQLEAAPGAAPVAIEEAAVAQIAEAGGPFPAPPRRHPYGDTALSLPTPPPSTLNTPPAPPHHPLTLVGSGPRVPVFEDGGAEGPPQHRQEVFGRTDAPSLCAPPHPPNLPLCLIHGAETIHAQRPAVTKGQPGG